MCAYYIKITCFMNEWISMNFNVIDNVVCMLPYNKQFIWVSDVIKGEVQVLQYQIIVTRCQKWAGKARMKSFSAGILHERLLT